MRNTRFGYIREFLENKAVELASHERKSFARIGIDESNYLWRTVQGRRFCIIPNNTFYHLLETVIVEACEKHPDMFGKMDSDSVLQALLNIERPFGVRNLAEYKNYLKTEHFAWIVEIEKDAVIGDILRVDLFRDIKPNLTGNPQESEFIGGIFHVFKHFSYNGTPLSTQPDRNDLSHPTDIYVKIIQGFFIEQKNPIGTELSESKTPFDLKYELHNIFYHEINTDVYFINTIIKKKRFWALLIEQTMGLDSGEGNESNISFQTCSK